jgi:hypothetical protein
MATIPQPPLFSVTETIIEYETLLQRARMGPEEPFPSYQFGGNRKTFWSNLQPNGVYDKPVLVSGGHTTHLEDPDLISQNP